MSLTRGEGGQNLLGPEQGEILGVLRTQELLAARRIDGAEQFFARAIDFGYSKSAADTFARWPRQEVLSDIVWTIRRFRPDIVVQVFTGTPADGHGHHQASGQLAGEAFHAAASAECFPEQLRRVEPWQPMRLLQGCLETDLQEACFRIDADESAEHATLSYGEIALASRGMHRTQGMHTPGRRAPGGSLRYLEGQRFANDIFEGIDTTWNRVYGGAEVGSLLDAAVAEYAAGRPRETLIRLHHARRAVAALADHWAVHKKRELDEAIARVAGVPLRAVADRWAVVPGSSVDIGIRALDRTAKVFVSHDQPYTQPYWLGRPHGAYLYEVPDQEMIGRPESPPAVEVSFRVSLGDGDVPFTQPAVSVGEPPSPIAIVPPVSLSVREKVLLFPQRESKAICVEVRSQAAPVTGECWLQAPSTWSVEPRLQGFSAGDGAPAPLSFLVTPPEGEDRAEVHAVARAGAVEYRSELVVVEYPDLPRQAILRPAAAKLVRADARSAVRKTGYIMGAGDEVPEALRQLGCDVTLLSDDDLQRGDLTRFEAIVAGVRAFNVRPDLHAHKDRLLDFMAQGGAWVVQYNVRDRRSPEAVADTGPFPLQVGTARVTGEAAPVCLLDPEHPLLHVPNEIGPADFQGWVQERGLYFASEWDARYTALLECHDDGEEPQRGALLCAPYGKGVFVFTAFSWFRQLPAGVPGAYRIFANLVSAGRA